MIGDTNRNWNFSNKSVSAEGGNVKKYKHYCPLGDFKLIIRIIIEIYKKKGVVSRKNIIESLEGKKLEKGSIFTKDRQEYKVAMAFHFLLDYSLMYPYGTVFSDMARGKKPIGYKLKRTENEILEFINNFEQFKNLNVK